MDLNELYYMNKAWEANAHRAIEKLDSFIRGVPNGPQGNIMRSVF